MLYVLNGTGMLYVLNCNIVPLYDILGVEAYALHSSPVFIQSNCRTPVISMYLQAVLDFVSPLQNLSKKYLVSLTRSRPPDKSALLKIIFRISQPKHMLWVIKRWVSMSRFI